MTILSRLREYLPGNKPVSRDVDPAAAYDMWALSYDAQPGNLMLDLDEELFSGLMKKVSFADKVVVDIGCGTGRHWKKILGQDPAGLVGYDVSVGMLSKLKTKYPDASTFVLHDNALKEMDTASADYIVSTLTVAHIQNIVEAFAEWSRVLKVGGEVIITDYHPMALSKGGRRTFSHKGATISVRNYVHSIEKIFDTFRATGFEFIEIDEQVIDDSVKSYYQEQNALHVFERFKNVPIIYGMRLRKRNAATKP